MYNTGKSIPYEYVLHPKTQDFNKEKDTHFNIRVDAQILSLKAIVLVFEDPYTAGARDSEKFKGQPNNVYDGGLKGRDLWEQAYRFFGKEKSKPQHMDMKKFFTQDKFRLVIDMRTTRDPTMHGSGKRIMGSNEGVQLAIDRKRKGSGTMTCHIYVVSDAQLDIMNRAYMGHSN